MVPPSCQDSGHSLSPSTLHCNWIELELCFEIFKVNGSSGHTPDLVWYQWWFLLQVGMVWRSLGCGKVWYGAHSCMVCGTMVWCSQLHGRVSHGVYASVYGGHWPNTPQLQDNYTEIWLQTGLQVWYGTVWYGMVQYGTVTPSIVCVHGRVKCDARQHDTATGRWL